jgi:CubicO group peptidase (beta-lactamase class C family)
VSVPQLGTLDAEVERVLTEEGVVGASLVVVEAGAIVYSGAFGCADLETGHPVTTRTAFHAASITKPVLATALLQLFERGRFGLDDPVNDHLGDARITNDWEDEAPVTIRGLLTHSAGLPVGNVPADPKATRLEDLVRATRTAERPGGRIVYANWGYDVLGHLLGVLEGRPWDEVVRDRVFAPLGMASSALDPAPLADVLARGCFRSEVDGQQHALRPFTQSVWPPTAAGSLVSTAEDLARFLAAHLGGGSLEGNRVLSAEALDEMHRVQARSGDSPGGMGLGFRVDRLEGRRLLCHGGDGVGYTNFLGGHPDEGVGVVLLTNSASAQGARSRIVQLALERALATAPAPARPVELPRSDSTAVEGRYRSTYWDIRVDVVPGSDGPEAHVSEGLVLADATLATRLEPLGELAFRGRDGMFHGFELHFERGAEGRVERFFGGLYPFEFVREGEAELPTPPTPDPTMSLLGRFLGTTRSPFGPLPVELAIEAPDRIRASLLGLQDAAVEQAHAAAGRVEGEFSVEVPDLGTFRIFVRLVASGRDLEGRCIARGEMGEFSMPTQLREQRAALS